MEIQELDDILERLNEVPRALRRSYADGTEEDYEHLHIALSMWNDAMTKLSDAIDHIEKEGTTAHQAVRNIISH